MTKGLTLVQRRTDPKVIDVVVPKDIEQYQVFMVGVDCGDQHRVMGTRFLNVAHFKK